MNRFNTPVIKLLDINQNLAETFSKVWLLAKDNTPLEQIKLLGPQDLDNFMATDIPTQEYIFMIFSIEGMPRAFWDQLDRCRLASFWEQSARVLNMSNFADERHYWTPDSCAKGDERQSIYEGAMVQAQEHYAKLVKLGVPVEDARGVIPMHVLTRGTMAINLRALKGVIKNRVCFIMQGGYWFPVVDGMIRELKPHLPSKTLRSLVNLPCYGKDHCPVEGNVIHRLTGDDPNPVCPIYIKRFAKDKEAVEAREKERHPNYDTIKENYFQLLRTLGMEEGGQVESSKNSQEAGH